MAHLSGHRHLRVHVDQRARPRARDWTTTGAPWKRKTTTGWPWAVSVPAGGLGHSSVPWQLLGGSPSPAHALHDNTGGISRENTSSLPLST